MEPHQRRRLEHLLKDSDPITMGLALARLWSRRAWRAIQPRRRVTAHWVGGRRRQICPRDMLFPISIGQVIIFIAAAFFPPERVILIFAIGSLVLAWLAMSPYLLKQIRTT